MPDWRALVTERLGVLDLHRVQRHEIIEELACHLEDFYRCQRAQGFSESVATERALAEVADWQELAHKISVAQHEEENVNSRTKNFWLPGLVNLAASMVWLMILQLTIGHVRMQWVHNHVLIATYVAWLGAQPLCGALGAYMSRRAGGQRRSRLAAGLFPSIALLVVFFWIAVIALFVERNHFVLDHPLYFTMVAFPWVILPATALLVGALPFLKTPKIQEA